MKLNISVSSVKACRNGSVIISCNNTDDSDKIKNLVNDTLKNYNVKRLPSLNPRLRISGINGDISEDGKTAESGSRHMQFVRLIS